MVSDLTDQTVVVTGGSSGLGLAVARRFLKQGAFVFLLARDPTRLRTALEGLPAEHRDRVERLPVDVTCESAVESAFDQIRSSRASIDFLINAAGISHRAAILETTPDQFRQHWELNFMGTVHCTRAAATDLMRVKGSLVNIGSLASKVASSYLGAYPVSKFSVAAYTQQLRMELGPKGLHVLLVCPGPIQRPDAGRRYDDQSRGLPEAARRPGGGARLKAIDPDDLADRILAACQRRAVELVLPAKVRWLAAISQLWPSLADRIVRQRTTDSR